MTAIRVASPHRGDRSVCPCGTPVEYDEMDGWEHADGSISHDGELSDKSVSDLMSRTAAMRGVDYDGETGNPDHITRTEAGHIPIGAVALLHGARGEVPGEHRNRQGAAWEAFKADIAANGIQKPIFITVDHGEEPKLSEGSHRRDAAVELGHSHIPVEVRYYGHAEHQGTVEQRAAQRKESVGSHGSLPDDAEFHFTPSQRRIMPHSLAMHSGGAKVGELLWRGADGDIVHVQVHPDYRRRGIASALYSKAHELADERDERGPAGSVFQTPTGHAFRSGYDGEQRPDVSGIPTTTHAGKGEHDTDLREHLIEHHYPSSAPMVRKWDDETAQLVHERIRESVDPCGWQRTAARFTPHQRVFGPTCGLDHRLFDNDHLRPEVRSDVLGRFTAFCAARGYREWSRWGRLIFFGSEASEWTSSSLEGNGDFDLSLGVDYPIFRQCNPAYAAMTDQGIATMFTQQMHAELNDAQHYFTVFL